MHKTRESLDKQQEELHLSDVSVSLPIESFDADEFLNKKDIWNHPYITDRTGKNGYEVAHLMAEFANSVIGNKS